MSKNIFSNKVKTGALFVTVCVFVESYAGLSVANISRPTNAFSSNVSGISSVLSSEVNITRPNILFANSRNTTTSGSSLDNDTERGQWRMDWSNNRMFGKETEENDAERSNILGFRNYYPASRENAGLGSNTLQGLCSGNRRFTDIPGHVVECLIGDVETALKPYDEQGAAMYSGDLRFYEDPTNDVRNTDAYKNLRNPLSDKRVYVPADVCKKNIGAIKMSLSNKINDAINSERNALHHMDSAEGGRNVHKAQYLQDFYRRAYSEIVGFVVGKDYLTQARTSNQYIMENMDNIFSENSRIGGVDDTETIQQGGCQKGKFTKCIAPKDGEMSAYCVDEDVNGAYLNLYIKSHPETGEILPATTWNILKVKSCLATEKVLEVATSLFESVSAYVK